jgi:predicted  nucleic acid-binding Zn-ribbon protein
MTDHLKLLVAFGPLILAGCLTPLTSRMDEANALGAQANFQLAAATTKLEEAKTIMQDAENKLDQANATFIRLESRLDEMDKKFGTVEQGFRKLFLMKEEEQE